MPLTFPRNMTGLARWTEPSFELMYRQELARDAGGPTQAKDLGPALWRASFTSVPLRLSNADAVIADFRSLRGSVRSFLLHPPTRPRPAASGDLSSSTVTVHSVRNDASAIRLSGLPSLFVMTAGDYVSIETGSGGIEFLQLVRGGEASIGGLSPELEVVPFVRPAVDVGNAVKLVEPVAEFILQPGALDDPFVGLTHRQISFTATQVIR
jgi:hypothetical protein